MLLITSHIGGQGHFHLSSCPSQPPTSPICIHCRQPLSPADVHTLQYCPPRGSQGSVEGCRTQRPLLLLSHPALKEIISELLPPHPSSPQASQASSGPWQLSKGGAASCPSVWKHIQETRQVFGRCSTLFPSANNNTPQRLRKEGRGRGLPNSEDSHLRHHLCPSRVGRREDVHALSNSVC